MEDEVYPRIHIEDGHFFQSSILIAGSPGGSQHVKNPKERLYINGSTIWLFNIALENKLFIDEL